MGVLDKLAFWKKKDDFDFGKDDSLGADPLGGGKDFLAGNDPFSGDAGADPFAGPDPLNHSKGQLAGSQDPFATPGQSADSFSSGNAGSRDPFSQAPPGTPAAMQQPFAGAGQNQGASTHHAELYGKDLEVVSAKLDSIRYTLESMNQRLQNLERIAHGEHTVSKDW